MGSCIKVVIFFFDFLLKKKLSAECPIFKKNMKERLFSVSVQCPLPDATRRYPTLPDATRCYPTLPDATRRYPMLPDATRRYRRYPTLLTLPNATRRYPTIPDATRRYLHDTQRYSTLLHAKLFTATLRYSTHFGIRFSTCFQSIF
jgi:hypothetical protein